MCCVNVINDIWNVACGGDIYTAISSTPSHPGDGQVITQSGVWAHMLVNAWGCGLCSSYWKRTALGKEFHYIGTIGSSGTVKFILDSHTKNDVRFRVGKNKLLIDAFLLPRLLNLIVQVYSWIAPFLAVVLPAFQTEGETNS